MTKLPADAKVERMSEALFNLSDSLRPYLGDDKLHARYEAVVAAWQDFGALEQSDAEQGEALALLRRLEPHLDAIVCYASTMGEHEPNRIARDVRAFLSTPQVDNRRTT